jgi:UDP-N-acetylmuramyl tripeptide synthase
LASAKLSFYASRAAGRGGSNLPGKVALTIDPAILRTLGARVKRGSILVTGTNGKTTTARMLTSIMRTAGYRVIHNPSGANLRYGVAAAFVNAADCLGRIEADYAVFEVDEGWLPLVANDLKCVGLVVTNFSRDQVDRYGQIENVVTKVGRGLASIPGGFCVLNADDPLVASLDSQSGRIVRFFGAENGFGDRHTEGHLIEGRHCPRCGALLTYKVEYFAHAGIYQCPGCGYGRPTASVILRKIKPRGAEGSLLTVEHGAGPLEVSLAFPGLFNAYNALAALTAATCLGIDENVARLGLERCRPAFGRGEVVKVRGRKVFIGMVKNPVGCNEMIKAIVMHPQPKALIVAMNDPLVRGIDVGWIWDVGFENLFEGPTGFERTVVSGTWADDLALRLKYASAQDHRIRREPDYRRALELGLAAVPPGAFVFALCNYTGMLMIRKVLQPMGRLTSYWIP